MDASAPSHDAVSWSALLYVAAAVAPDGHLSDPELKRIGELLRHRFPSVHDDESAVDALLNAIDRLPAATEEQFEVIDRAASVLKQVLNSDERQTILSDVLSVARADGIVLNQERRFISELADHWEVAIPSMSQPIDSADGDPNWSPIHDLTLIFLVLAHGTDNELSKNEVQMMIRKLKEWLPDVPEGRIREILRDAMNRYAGGVDDETMHGAIISVKNAMPASKRMAALHDLVQIANADGVFLDVEEDLINNLQSEWEVDPYANYGRHGEKE